MSYNSGFVKSSCFSQNVTTIQKKCKAHKNTPKKVVTSTKFISCGSENKSCSTSAVSTKKCQGKSKKITQSEISVTQKCQNTHALDYCRKCGDEIERNQSKNDIHKIVTAINSKCVRNDNNVNAKKKTSKPIQQYYKNENFHLSSESVPSRAAGYTNKHQLDTIKEVSELNTTSEDSLFVIYSDSEDDVNLDPDDEGNIEKLKQFRNKNYFECHSTKSRINNKPSVTSLNDHKCVYRFYLNDRLFPVPLNTDYNNKIRCVECHLPMEIKTGSKDEKINGTIQAKVKYGKDTQDIVLLLPVKESLIIKERRREERKDDDKYVYFGVVKLTNDGNTTFNRKFPQDSLALKYQKGYKEFKFDERYSYKNMDDSDVIVI